MYFFKTLKNEKLKKKKKTILFFDLHQSPKKSLL